MATWRGMVYVAFVIDWRLVHHSERGSQYLSKVGALAGTLVGVPRLRRIPENLFRRIVAVILVLLGVYMLTTGQPR